MNNSVVREDRGETNANIFTQDRYQKDDTHTHPDAVMETFSSMEPCSLSLPQPSQNLPEIPTPTIAASMEVQGQQCPLQPR